MATIDQIRAYAATVTNGQTIERYNEFGDIVEIGFRTSEWVYAWFNVFTFMDGRTDCSYMYHYSQRTGKATKRKWDGRNLTHKIEDCTTSYNIVSESRNYARFTDGAFDATVKLESREIIEVAAEEVNATDQDPDPAEPETAYKIQVRTNEYQAARNISFPRGCGTIWANEGTEYESKAEAVQALLQLAIYNSYGEPMAEPAELISWLIYDQARAVGTSEAEYIRAHPRLIGKLAKLNGWEGPGVYEAGRLIYPEGSESHEYDGYYYKIIEITK